ncbi:MAG: acyl-ACP--UDP-N-acetylglucosamine O-acyltransferase [Candidatus Babeliales bacterium]
MNKENVIFPQASLFEEAFFNSTASYIDPTARIGSNVKVGSNVKIGPFCIVTGNVTIGDNTRLYAHVAVGFPAQNIGTKESQGTITIGANCELREFSTVHASKYSEGTTTIGDNCYLMSYSHVAHDCILENNVTLINNVNLGGHTHIEKNVIVMANGATHQFCRVGQYSAVAPYSATRQDLAPFCLFDGQPAGFAGLNIIGLKRAGFSKVTIDALKHVTKLFFQDRMLPAAITIAAANEPWGKDEMVGLFLQFIAESKRGVSRRTFIDNRAATDQWMAAQRDID